MVQGGGVQIDRCLGGPADGLLPLLRRSGVSSWSVKLPWAIQLCAPRFPFWHFNLRLRSQSPQLIVILSQIDKYDAGQTVGRRGDALSSDRALNSPSLSGT